LGGLATVVAMVVAAMLPAGGSPVLTIILVGAAFEAAQRLHGARYRTFIESGGSRHSDWRVVGIALALLLASFAVRLIAALLQPDSLLPVA
jgi:hypothetical protein